jgi:hypothetical protein
MRFNLWGSPRASERRAFHEKAFRREGLAAWDARWHALSLRARDAYLYEVKGATHGARQSGTRASVPVRALAPDVVRELVEAGLVELGSATLLGPRDQLLPVKAAADFATRLRTVDKYRLLTTGPAGMLPKYFDRCFYTTEASSALQAVLRRAGFEDFLRTDALLSLYVSNHHWPGWVAGLLNDPAVTKVLKVLQDAGEPVLLAKLPELLPDIAPETIRAAVSGMISYLAVFEDLHPQTRDIMVGLLPAVRKSLATLLVPRQRPPLVECATPRDLGPEESLIVEDLRGSLLEIASEPPRLRRDKVLFQKELDRFVESLPTIPEWTAQALGLPLEERLIKAFDWARGLSFVKEKMVRNQLLLEMTSRGNEWLVADLDKQFEHILGVLRTLASSKTPGPSHGSHIAGIDLWDSYSRSDYRFLGSQIVVIKAPEQGGSRPYWQTKPEDFQALREAVYQGFQSLSIGTFYRLNSVLEHLAFENHNPLLLGLDQRQVSVYENGRSIPPLAERREEVACRFLDTFIRKRLLPLGCLQAAIDETDALLIARLPRLDAYFGRPVATGEMAVAMPKDTRVVVQPDFSIVIIGLNPAPAAQLAPFCERTKRSSGSGALILKLTRESVVKAVAAGLKPAEVVQRLQRVASNEVPANVLRQVQDWCGWVRHARTSTRTIIRCTDSESADRVMAVLKRNAERLNETVVALTGLRLTPADRTKIRDQGIIIESE